MKNKRQDVDPENLKRDLDEPTSPSVRVSCSLLERPRGGLLFPSVLFVRVLQRDSSRGRHREKEDIKIIKERTPASEEEPVEWETNREGSAPCSAVLAESCCFFFSSLPRSVQKITSLFAVAVNFPGRKL